MKEQLQLLKTTCKNWIKSYFFQKRNLDCTQNQKKIYVMLAATYQNLGDLAITEAQIRFLKDNFSDYKIIEINVNDTLNYYRSMKKNMNNLDMITLIGGGNNGDLYEFIESKRRFILNKFKNQKIISFPQSVMYKESSAYQKKFVKLCKKCYNLTLCAREDISFNKYSKMGLSSVILTPDIVFYLDKYIEKTSLENREGITFVLRNDKEKQMTQNMQDKIIKYIVKKKINHNFADTCDITYTGDRKQMIKDYIKKLSSKKLVITDRLHGMILCYITNTPCIAIDNNNHKISATFNTWLKNQNFIKLVSEYNEAKETIELLLNIKEIKKENICKKYRDLIKIMK